uniref:Cystatin-B n=1 Tax=Mola mola TaxID=94237 RepID=A0A3Q3WU82_MOLML
MPVSLGKSMSMVGAFTDAKDANLEIQKICDQVKAQIEKKTHWKYEEFRPVEYKEQNVAGVNYFIKVYIGGDSYLHLKVFSCGQAERRPDSIFLKSPLPCTDWLQSHSI